MYSRQTLKIIKKILICPKCKGSLNFKNKKWFCAKGHQYEIIDDVIVFRERENLSEDVLMGLDKWEKIHKEKLKIKGKYGRNHYIVDYNRYTEKFFDLNPGNLYLDLGCGFAFNSIFATEKGAITINSDISLPALLASKKLFDKNKKDGIFICADMLKLPFKKSSFDYIFSSVSLSYFKDTQKVIKKMSEIIKDNGSALCIVPVLSLTSLIFQFKTGIFNLPFLRLISEFINFKVFKGHYLESGYSIFYTPAYWKNLFDKYFNDVSYSFFETNYQIDFFKNLHLKKIAKKFLKYKLFWPYAYFYVQKK